MDLGKRRMLYIKSGVVDGDNIVNPTIVIKHDDRLDFLNTAVDKINTAIIAKGMVIPKSTVQSSKYKAKIT